MVNIAVLGYGTVGSGVVEVIKTNQASIDKRAGRKICIKYVLDIREFPEDPIKKILTNDYQKILDDDEVSVIAEVMGGVEPAYIFVKQALMYGKSVVTSNKELVAKHGAELLRIAKEREANFLFEASVGGGIPIIRPLNQSLTADEIYEITGILNGTTNFILTRMAKEGRAFDDVLKEAQNLGYAEREPRADIEGYDACRKIAILASLAFGMQVDFEEIPTEGITRISKEDMHYAQQMNCVIKLLATCRKKGNEVFASVSPRLIPEDHPLANVDGVFNAIFVKGNVIGDVMFYGSGAGKLPTASAVVADIIDAVKHLGTNIMTFWDEQKADMMNQLDAKVRYFIRLECDDADSMKTRVENFFGKVTWVKVKHLDGEYGFITEADSEGMWKEKIEEFEKEIKIRNRIRMGE